ncbi:hypothetical protein ACIBCN_17110 [Nocardia sp. NPDC051052]|uniref:hypothetical protein n=2 Tax=unclassified Nocardia TaxID=2637762 RepID=UPI0037896F13
MLFPLDPWSGEARQSTRSGQQFATSHDKGSTMRLTFIGEDPGSNPNGSPTVYRTDRDSWIVQGWVVTDPDALAHMNIPQGETCVEIPDRMIQFFRKGDRGIDSL